jgi:hypothetical protein
VSFSWSNRAGHVSMNVENLSEVRIKGKRRNAENPKKSRRKLLISIFYFYEKL